jgi:hypothetical protein
MDPLSLQLGALRVSELLARLILLYDKQDAADLLDPILGELIILQNVLMESTFMIQDLRNEAPYSAGIALDRCNMLGDQMERLTSRLEPGSRKMGKIRRVAHLALSTDKLKNVAAAFKSAVLLFRDIATK